jgi:hypothetical protein
VAKSALKQILHACSADKQAQADCEKYGIWLANRSGAGLLIIPGVLGLSFSLEGASNQQSAKCLRKVTKVKLNKNIISQMYTKSHFCS